MVFTGSSRRVGKHSRLLTAAVGALKDGLAVVLVATGLLAASSGGVTVQARESAPVSAAVDLAVLPAEARRTHQAIRSGGPFRYSKDGVVFGNRERLLPRHPRGYYREYTVPTPGLNHRGARRIVCGGPVPVVPDACYYTDDHYASFRLIAQ